jgi:GntR family uxuAB operon transcriptional repressor
MNGRRSYQTIASQIEALIRTKYEIGDRLPGERDLAKRYNVSRPTVREAIVSLEIAGLVDVKTNSGIYVAARSASPSGEDPGAPPFEILRARMIVEPEVAALAAENAVAEDFRKLEAALAQMREEDARDEPTELGDRMFHCALAEACGNGMLTELVELLWDRQQKSEMWLKADSHGRTPELRPSWVADHLAVFGALERRDGKSARDAMTHHLGRVWEIFLEAGAPE